MMHEECSISSRNRGFFARASLLLHKNNLSHRWETLFSKKSSFPYIGKVTSLDMYTVP
jgi:hypothetical protein